MFTDILDAKERAEQLAAACAAGHTRAEERRAEALHRVDELLAANNTLIEQRRIATAALDRITRTIDLVDARQIARLAKAEVERVGADCEQSGNSADIEQTPPRAPEPKADLTRPPRLRL